VTAADERLQTALAGRYASERELGSGGMATVYLAHDVRHDRKVALKVLRPELAVSFAPERFLREIHRPVASIAIMVSGRFISAAISEKQAVAGQATGRV
jgi:serine/threonine-protein kinase